MNIGLIFGMVVAVFMMSLLFVFGYQQMSTVTTIQGEAEIKRTISNLENAVDRVYSLGGESSDRFRLTFPDSVIQVCFMPAYRGMQISYKESRLKADLRYILDSSGDAYRLSQMLTEMRIKPSQENPAVKADEGQTLLLFYKATAVPTWYYIKYLEPTKEGGVYSGTPLCVTGRSEVWLQRSFDEDGAWVDVREA
jgi:hypothetical protein